MAGPLSSDWFLQPLIRYSDVLVEEELAAGDPRRCPLSYVRQDAKLVGAVCNRPRPTAYSCDLDSSIYEHRRVVEHTGMMYTEYLWSTQQLNEAMKTEPKTTTNNNDTCGRCTISEQLLLPTGPASALGA